jgi:hypothetical protein
MVECSRPATRHDTPPNTQFLIVICDSMLVGAIVQSSFDSRADNYSMCGWKPFCVRSYRYDAHLSIAGKWGRARRVDQLVPVSRYVSD